MAAPSRLFPANWLLIGLLVLFSTGCAEWGTTGKVLVTPIVAVRDTVDAPLVTLTNLTAYWGRKSDPLARPTPGVGVGTGGVSAGIFADLGFYFFWGVSGIFGGVDYVVCRCLYPQWPVGLSPWKRQDQSWGSLYYPGTRAVWTDNPPDTFKKARARKKAQQGITKPEPSPPKTEEQADPPPE